MKKVAKPQVAVNPFHKIRIGELKREAQCLKGAPPSSIKSYFTPTLKEICAKVIADTFETQPDNLEEKLKESEDLYRLIIDQLSTDLPLAVSVPRVKSQDYWRACVESRWSVGEITQWTASGKFEPSQKGGWKRLYLERNLEENLMSLPPGTTAELPDATSQLIALSQGDIYSLRLVNQRCHFDISDLFSRLPHLESFLVTYSVLNAGISFKFDMLGMKQHDATALHNVLKSSNLALRSLSLPSNAITSEMLKGIVGGLVKNTTLTHFDLSHNRIDSEGVAALATILMKPGCPLKHLDLTDNEIEEQGGKAIGRALSTNKSLTQLSLRMNRLTDGGGQKLFNGLRNNSTLISLNVANNDLSAETARSLVESLSGGPSNLTSLDASGNVFNEEGGHLLVAAVRATPTLLEVDVRASGVADADIDTIREITKSRVAQKHAERAAVEEAQMRQDIQRLVAEKVRKTHGM